METGACLRTIEQAGHGLCAVFAPGGRHAVVGTKEGALDVLDVGAAVVVETQPAHASAVRGAPRRWRAPCPAPIGACCQSMPAWAQCPVFKS